MVNIISIQNDSDWEWRWWLAVHETNKAQQWKSLKKQTLLAMIDFHRRGRND